MARRGQPCIMSALTAAQLFRIQSLDTQSDQMKLWMTSLCRSSCSYRLNILSLLFKDANTIFPKLWAFSDASQPWVNMKIGGMGGLPSGWFGSFILNPGALLSMSVCWFNVVVWNYFCISEEITPKTHEMQHCCCRGIISWRNWGLIRVEALKFILLIQQKIVFRYIVQIWIYTIFEPKSGDFYYVHLWKVL